MRLLTGGVVHVAGVIEEDLRDRETSLHKAHMQTLLIWLPVLWQNCCQKMKFSQMLPICYLEQKY